MEKETSLELRRQAFHTTFGIVTVLLVMNGAADWKLFFWLLLSGAILSAVSARKKLPVISWFLSVFERKDAAFPGKGALFYILGITLVLAFFEQSIALASIMVLALGDSASHLAGKLLGKTRHPFNNHKFLEGSLIGFATATAGALFFVPLPEAAIASAAAMAVEAIEIKYSRRMLDDNITVPLVAALVMHFVRVL